MASKGPTSPIRALDAECTRSGVASSLVAPRPFLQSRLSSFLTATCSRSVALRRKTSASVPVLNTSLNLGTAKKRRAYEALPEVRAAHRLVEQRCRERKREKVASLFLTR